MVDLDSTNGLYSGGQKVASVQFTTRPTRVQFGGNPNSPYADFEQRLGGEAKAAGFASEERVATPAMPHASRTLTVGRSRQCDVSVPTDLQMSRRHARVSLTPMGAIISDLGSHNGVWVNGKRQRSAKLESGDHVQLGQSRFVYRNGNIHPTNSELGQLEVRSISVNTKELTLLEGINFAIKPRTMTAVIGPSGSGKSTLLNSLTGTQVLTAGTVSIGGHDLHANADLVRGAIGFVPQDDAVHTTLTVRVALEAAARLRLPTDTSSSEIRARVETVADQLGLGERLNQRVSQLSGGQRKRVSVGYELVGSPKILILDEPTSGLDPLLERELMEMLHGLSRSGMTVVVVTHHTANLALADNVAIMARGGTLAYFGQTGNVVSHFGVENIEGVFKLLASPTPEWEQYLTRRAQPRRDPGQVGKSPIEPVLRSAMADISTMTTRYVQMLSGDLKRVLPLALQAPLLGLLFAFVIPTNAFEMDGQVNPATRQLLMALVLVMIWLGASNSVREIVDERDVFRREVAVGVSPSAFVMSKWFVLALVTSLQAMVLFLVATWRQNDAVPGGLMLSSGAIEMMIALVGIGVASVGLGLVVSARSQDAARALGTLPIVAVTAFLLSGLVVPVNERASLNVLSSLNSALWGSSALAVTVDLPAADGCGQLESAESAREDGPEELALPVKTSPSCSNVRWEQSQSRQAINFTVLVGLAILHCFAAVWATKRSFRPSRR